MKGIRELSGKQEKLIGLLLTERTVESACLKAHVGATTYWRWMKTDAFIQEYRRARRGILENTVSRLQALTSAAIDALERNLDAESSSSQIRSASIILEQAIKGLAVLDIEGRVEMLEEFLRTDQRK